MLMLLKSEWRCTVLVHMKAAQTRDRRPRGAEEPGLVVWIWRKNLTRGGERQWREIKSTPLHKYTITNHHHQFNFFSRIHLKPQRTKQWKQTGCSEGAACSIWKIWAWWPTQTDAFINPSIHQGQQTDLFDLPSQNVELRNQHKCGKHCIDYLTAHWRDSGMRWRRSRMTHSGGTSKQKCTYNFSLRFLGIHLLPW